MDEATYTVGALAKASGLTVLTLHHWDAIGLLVPAERAGNGYRRYGAGEVERLYRILALRRPGQEQYYTPEQLEQLAERREALGRRACARRRTTGRRAAGRR